MGQKSLSIGVDIGGTHITCAAVEVTEGKLLEDTFSRVAYSHEDTAEVILQSWASALNNTILKVEEAHLAGIGFAIPGPFDYRNGISKMKHKFPNLYDLHIPTALRDQLSESWKLSESFLKNLPMRFLNDATSFAVGEAWLGEGRGFQKVVVVTLGTGFGSAFTDNGVPVVARADVPKEGCLWHLPFKDGIADNYFSTGWFVREYEKQTGEKVDGVKALMEKTDAGDSIAKSLFAQFGRNLAECLAPWLQSFRAEVLVVGGNIARALPLFEAEFKNDLKKTGVSLKIAPSKLFETAALIGSARLLDDEFWEKVSAQLPNI